MCGYLDEDAAYFVGLLVGRGEVAEIQDRWTAVIDFPFAHSELEGFDRFTDFLSSVVTTVLPRLKALLGELVNLSCVPDRQRVAITVELPARLKVPVHEILWGHPNLRDPQASRLEQSPFREHQLRIYAHDFLEVGFYINHKQEILKKLADENKQQIRRGISDPSSPCNGVRRFRPKEHHPLENDERLPEHIRGRHFDAYWQICAACGCPLAQKAIKEMKRQRRLIDDEGA
jgi:hypothetical protein